MTHQIFLLAESGMLPAEHERRTASRQATARAWMVHIAAHLRDIWPAAPADLDDAVDRWFAANGERLEILELTLAEHVAAGPIDDLLTRERRVEYGGAARWLAEAVGDICDPTGQGGPAFARAVGHGLDDAEEAMAARAAEIRAPDPDDRNLGEQAELVAHIEAVCALLEEQLPRP